MLVTKFGAYTSLYSNSAEARRCFASCQDKVDVHIAHFGKYTDFDPENKLIDNAVESLEAAKDYGCHIVESRPLSEFVKRDMAPQIASELDIDFLIIIDSDEWIDKTVTEFEKFKEMAINIAEVTLMGKYNIFNCIVEYGNQTFKALPRIWYQPQDIYYNKTHFALKTRNPTCPYNFVKPELERHPAKALIPHIQINSGYNFRTQAELDASALYHTVLSNKESIYSNNDQFM